MSEILMISRTFQCKTMLVEGQALSYVYLLCELLLGMYMWKGSSEDVKAFAYVPKKLPTGPYWTIFTLISDSRFPNTWQRFHMIELTFFSMQERVFAHRQGNSSTFLHPTCMWGYNILATNALPSSTFQACVPHIFNIDLSMNTFLF